MKMWAILHIRSGAGESILLGVRLSVGYGRWAKNGRVICSAKEG
jgi:hypothetical protein